MCNCKPNSSLNLIFEPYMQGLKQSPIDIPTSRASNSINARNLNETDNISFEAVYRVSDTVVDDLGITIHVNLENDGALAFWDESYDLRVYKVLQLHFHAPSEHTFNGKHYDVEMHIVHQDYDNKKLAVLGVFFDVDEGGDLDNEFIHQLRLHEYEPTIETLPLTKLIHGLDQSELYHYEGSLTTPPCDETVTWLLVNDPQPIS